MSKHKIILDPDADGTQWLYRGMGICDQSVFPQLLHYACYDWLKNGSFIGVATTKRDAKKLIDEYLLKKMKTDTYMNYASMSYAWMYTEAAKRECNPDRITTGQEGEE